MVLIFLSAMAFYASPYLLFWKNSSPPGFLPLQMALGRIRSWSLFSGGSISNILYSVAAAVALNSSIALASRIQISGIGGWPLCWLCPFNRRQAWTPLSNPWNKPRVLSCGEKFRELGTCQLQGPPRLHGGFFLLIASLNCTLWKRELGHSECCPKENSWAFRRRF